jgi:hypothetical protein
MAREDRQLEIVPAPANGGDLNWSWLLGCDALFMEQPYTDQHVNCVYTARFLGMPVWLDWGDDLFSINKTNPALFADHRLRDKTLLRENVGQLFEHASVVTMATETLRWAYGRALAETPNTSPQTPNTKHQTPKNPTSEIMAKMVVIPEGCRWPMSTSPRRKVVTWRGLSSHYDDVEGVAKQLADVFIDREFADWKLLLFGDPSPEFLELMGAALGKRLMVCPYLATPWHMMSAWAGEAPFLHVYPALNNAFNLAKPPSVWLEASAIGAAVIGPDFPEWKPCEGLIHYAPMFFGDRVKEELRKFVPVSAPSQEGEITGQFHPNVPLARKQIYPHLTMDAVNELRWGVIKKLQTSNTKNQINTKTQTPNTGDGENTKTQTPNTK